jgi:hypothetical protein
MSPTTQSGSKDFSSFPAPLLPHYRNGIASPSVSGMIEREHAEKSPGVAMRQQCQRRQHLAWNFLRGI